MTFQTLSNFRYLAHPYISDIVKTRPFPIFHFPNFQNGKFNIKGKLQLRWMYSYYHIYIYQYDEIDIFCFEIFIGPKNIVLFQKNVPYLTFVII